jgi:hypothetical protein
MKLFINFLASVVSTVYVATFVSLLSSLAGCQNNDSVNPANEPKRGLNNLIYEPIDSDAGAFTITAGLCKNGLPVDPKNLTADVFNFSPGTSPADAIRQITDTETGDEDGDSATDIVEPDQSFPVWVSTTEDGKQVTNYQADKTFLFRVDSAMLIVVRLTDEAGNESFTTLQTNTGTSAKTCLHL